MRRALPVIGWWAAFGAALIGSVMLNAHGQAVSSDFPVGGAVLIAAAALSTLIFALSVRVERLPALARPAPPAPIGFWQSRTPLRLIAAVMGAIFAWGAWVLVDEGQFTPTGVVFWGVSVAACFYALDDRSRRPIRWGQLLTRFNALFQGKIPQIRLRLPWSVAALVGIMAVAAYLRFYNIPAYPPDLDSDHVEVLLDVERIVNAGWRPVFVPSNSGRELTHFYFLAALHQITGLPLTFELLKIGDSLIGLLLIPLMWWLGRALYGDEDAHLGNLIGLIAAAFVAVSYWHIMMSRAGLRIALMPVATVPVLVFLMRAARHNRRIDWLLCGLFLGISLYTYQSARILPLVVIAGWVVGMIMRGAWGRYTFNFAAAVLISLFVFVPSARYMVDYPDNFWQRTTARILGDDVDIFGDDASPDVGRILARNLPNFLENVRRSALMFNWRGDDTDFYGTRNGTAHADAVTGALFVMGIGVIGVRAFRRRDPVDPLLIVAILILLLPTALSLANLAEVPSAIRASGALPVLHIIAGLALAVLTRAVWQHFPAEGVRLLYAGGIILLWAAAAATNYYTYFTVQATKHYEQGTPYREMGSQIGAFVRSTGAPGNAYMLAFGLSWDHRALGIEAGLIGWDNGIVPEARAAWVEAKIRQNQGTRFAFRPDRQVFVIMKQEDVSGLAEMSRLFPGGAALVYRSARPGRDYLVYVAPPLGCEVFTQRYQLVSPVCDLIPLP